MKSLPFVSVRNPILVNLLMGAIVVGGVYSAFSLVREMFPEVRPLQVMVTTPYPGASPAEVEKGISIKIEEKIKSIEGIEDINTVITEGLSVIAISLYNDVDDVDQVVTDVKDAIDTIGRDDFPEEAEETVVARFEPRIPVINVSLYGDMTDAQLKARGKQLRDDILALDGVTDAVLSGARLDEISVEIHPDMLVRYGLSFMEIADAIRRGNMDLPGGQIKTTRANVAVRTLGEKDRGDALAELIVRADPNGQIVRLSDVATVVDGFEDRDVLARIDGKPGVSVTVTKTPSQDAVEIARSIKSLVAGKNRKPFPFENNIALRVTGQEKLLRDIYERAYANPYPDIGQVKVHTDLARFIEGRLELLTRNGFWGLFFVFLSLLFFLNWRVAFWVMLGLLLAILGTLVVMRGLGLTLNLISMFGLIVVLGMLVDDAIIVGEHIYSKVEAGEEPELAAIKGTEEVTKPVTCAIITTIVAFAPLLYISGQIGDFMRVLPIVVICALGVSLFEALTILPSHLAETFRSQARRPAGVASGALQRGRGLTDRLRTWQRRLINDVLRGGYARFLRVAIAYRYATLGIAVSVLIASAGLVAGGWVKIVFLQTMDSETVTASMKLPIGTPIARTDEAMRELERAALALPEMETTYALMGAEVDLQDGSLFSSTHKAQLIMELVAVETRERGSEEIINELRAKTADIAGVNSLTFGSVHGGPGGSAIQIEITGPRLKDLVAAADRVKAKLGEFDGVHEIEDDFDAGQREIQLELLDSGRVLGLTTESLATQVRAAFYGLEARKIQRDREDVKIMVRYPPSFRTRISDVELMRVATPGGVLVPLGEVARIKEGTGFSTIRRRNQERCVTVRAAVDEAVANSREILASLTPQWGKLQAEFPGIEFRLGGQAREMLKSFGSLKRDFAIALGLIYVILAGLFKSYIQPIVVMAVIPFGLIGAVIGHMVMGFPITMLSMIGLVALSGIVVNDSLILVDFINRRLAGGLPLHEAVIDAGLSRFRAIILTSITTILGLAPLLTEQSLQARFILPMAISIAFGLAFATVLTLVLVPCLYVMVQDSKAVARFARRLLWPTVTPARCVDEAATPDSP